MNNKMIKEEKEMEIDLLSLFFFLLDKWKILLLGVVIGAVAAAGITFLQTPMYQSTSTLYVLSKSTSITSVADLQLGSALTSDFTEIATSKPVIDTAIETLKNDENIKLTREQVQDMMSVSNKTDTRMLEITVTSDDAKLSYEVGKALTDAAVDQMAAITQTDKPTIVEHPEIAKEPQSNNLTKHVAMGILIALVLIGAIYTVMFITNDRIQSEEDVETYLETSVLGIIPIDKELEEASRSEEKEEKNRRKRKKK